ncbi:MAG: tetraacyldisaccharide 4'-kinase [Sumerlaeia bacterium]
MAPNLLSSINGFFTRLDRLRFDIGLSERKELSVPTLSVGNISFGGTGKTPFCLWLCQYLAEANYSPALLTRGYGREDSGELVVVHDGRRLRANTLQAGDEPVLLGKRLGNVPIIACADRYKGGRFVLKKAQVNAVVLDDGMQHYRLARQGELVLLDSTKDYFGAEGEGLLLREPLSALGRAHLIVLTRCQNNPQSLRLMKKLKKQFPAIPVVRTAFTHEGLRQVGTDVAAEPTKLPKKAFLAAGVAAPASFEKLIKEQGIEVVGRSWSKDHARFTPQDVRGWMQRRKALGADVVIVTEKDAVKLAEFKKLPKNLFYCPIRLEFLTSKDEELTKRVITARLKIKPISGYLK